MRNVGGEAGPHRAPPARTGLRSPTPLARGGAPRRRRRPRLSRDDGASRERRLPRLPVAIAAREEGDRGEGMLCAVAGRDTTPAGRDWSLRGGVVPDPPRRVALRLSRALLTDPRGAGRQRRRGSGGGTGEVAPLTGTGGRGGEGSGQFVPR